MPPLIVTLALFLDAVFGAAHPSITPAAKLVDRQALRTSFVWSSYRLTDNNIQYTHFSYIGNTVTTSASFWEWCSSSACLIATSCSSGTFYYPGTATTCSTFNKNCAIEYLLSSSGAQERITRFACPDPRDTTFTYTFFIVSPTRGAAMTTSTHQSGITTSIPTASGSSFPSNSISPAPSSPVPPPSSSTRIVVIVGGVLGGLAVIAVTAIAIFFLLQRRRQQTCGAAPTIDVGQHSVPSTQPPPPTTTYGNKHASVMYAQVPGSPPPMYQNQTGQNWNAYPMHEDNQVSEMPSNTAADHHLGGVGMITSPQLQAQYGSPRSVTFEMPEDTRHI